jgi:AraC-like DNA-binding protein
LLSARLRVIWPDRISRLAYPAVVQLRHQNHDAIALEPALLQRFSVGPGASVVLTRLASAMLADALRHELLGRRSKPCLANNPLGDARRMVEANPGHDWTVEGLARGVGMGRSNFSAQFTVSFGKPPMEFVTDVRMQRAADLLRSGTMSLYEISQHVGYSCEAAFSRRFLKHFGRSITAVRTEESQSREAPPAAEHFSVLLGLQSMVMSGTQRLDQERKR